MLQLNGFTQDSLKEIQGKVTYTRTERKKNGLIFYRQMHTGACTAQTGERERRERGRWKDRQWERQNFSETRNLCVMHYDHSV